MIKKTVITSLVLAHLALVLLVCGVIYLEQVYPFHPGDVLYKLQHTGEQARLSLTGGRTSRAEYAMVLAERRLADLAQAGTAAKIKQAVAAYEGALKTAALALDEAPQGAHTALYQRLDGLLVRSDVVVQTLGSQMDLVVLQELKALLSASRQAVDVRAVQSVLTGEVAAVAVPFLSTNVSHGSFDLFGGHYGVACQSCHQDGAYKGTADDCKSCHQPEAYQVYMAGIIGNDITDYQYEKKSAKPSGMYPDHYAGQCSDCHTVDSWDPVAFDHKGVFECISCHAKDTPSYNKNLIVNQKHYPGDCMQCHSSFESWEVTEYGHEGVQDCETCHQQEKPVNHYEGACADCHVDIQDWNGYVFDHASRSDCQTCHTGDTPANHFDGQCSNCHETTKWINYEYEHSSSQNCASCHETPGDHDYDTACSSCHKNERGGWTLTLHPKETNCQECHATPKKHYDLPCNTCHLTAAWNATIDHHTFEGDCQSCHEDSAPAGHYTGACSDCHTTDTWQDYTFDHTYYTNCISCHVEVDHYAGQCSDCHTTSDWTHVEVNHSYLYDCLSCHNTPTDHWPGQCSACHITTDWSEIHFDHTTYTNCNACHSRPSGHARGMCSECHTTDSWLITTPTPTATLMMAELLPDATATPEPLSTVALVIDEAPVDVVPVDVSIVVGRPDDELVLPPLITQWVVIEVTPVPVPLPVEPRPTEMPEVLPVPVPPTVDGYILSPILVVNDLTPELAP